MENLQKLSLFFSHILNRFAVSYESVVRRPAQANFYWNSEKSLTEFISQIVRGK